MCRTQHAVSAVVPSVGITYGLRNVARRVSPSGKSATFPSCTHERYPLARPRVIEEKRNPTIGTATTAAASALNRIPNFMKNPRRDMAVSLDGARTGLVDIV